MAHGPTTVVIDGVDRDPVVDALIELGFAFGTGIRTMATTLDTFDGRLHRAGVRLTLHDNDSDNDGRELNIVRPEMATARAAVQTPPEFAGDLPTDPFRSTIGGLIGVRPLIPRLRYRAQCTRAVCSDIDGLALAEIMLAEQLTVVDAAGAPQPSESISVVEVRGLLGSPKPARKAAIEGVPDVLANLATSIAANWQGTIDDADTDFLHDPRVAVRRTRSTIAQTKAVPPPRVVTKASRQSGWINDLSGPARDLDVNRLEWDDHARPLGADLIETLEPARALLGERQAAARAVLGEALTSPEGHRLVNRWPSRLARLPEIEPQGEHTGHTLGSVMRHQIIHAQTTLIDNGRLIQPDTPAEQVHDLRKDAKRLRHLLERLTERLDQIRSSARDAFAERFAAYDTDATTLAFDDMLDGLS